MISLTQKSPFNTHSMSLMNFAVVYEGNLAYSNNSMAWKYTHEQKGSLKDYLKIYDLDTQPIIYLMHHNLHKDAIIFKDYKESSPTLNNYSLARYKILKS